MYEILIQSYGPLLVSLTIGALLSLSVYLPFSTGQISLATPGFYTLGGYVAAVMATQIQPGAVELSFFFFLAEICAAGVICGLGGLLLGIPVLRLNSVYLAIATIAFTEVLRVVALNLDFTGGAIGIFGIRPIFQKAEGYLSVTMPVLALATLLIWRLENSKVGPAFSAIREDALAASSCGINPTRYKIASFAMGAALAGASGAIAAHFLNTWNARQGSFETGIASLAAVLTGGSRVLLGAVIGGILFSALPEVLREISNLSIWPNEISQILRDGRMVFFGGLIVAGLLFFPDGVITPRLLDRCRLMLGAILDVIGRRLWKKN